MQFLIVLQAFKHALGAGKGLRTRLKQIDENYPTAILVPQIILYSLRLAGQGGVGLHAWLQSTTTIISKFSHDGKCMHRYELLTGVGSENKTSTTASCD